MPLHFPGSDVVSFDTLSALLSTTPTAGMRATALDAPGSMLFEVEGKWGGDPGVFTSTTDPNYITYMAAIAAQTVVPSAVILIGTTPATAVMMNWQGSGYFRTRPSVAVPSGNRMHILGDSIAGRMGSPATLASILSGGKFWNAGAWFSYPGAASAEIKTHIADACVGLNPGDFIRIQAGTNNAGNPAAMTGLFADLAEMVLYCFSVGVVPYLSTIPNRSDTAVSADIQKANDEIYRVGVIYGVFVVDPWIPTRSATGGWVSGTSSDNVHPSGLGWELAGREEWAQMSPWLANVAPWGLPRINVGGYNKATNALMLTDDLSDGRANGWNWGGSGYTPSLTDSAIAERGKKQNIAIAAQTGNIRAYGSGVLGHNPVAGNRILSIFRIDIPAAMDFNASMRTNDGGRPFFNGYGIQLQTAIENGVIAIERTARAVEAIGCAPYVWKPETAGAQTGTISISQVGIYDLTAMGICAAGLPE